MAAKDINLLSLMRLAVKQIFGSEKIGEIIYNTFIEEEFQNKQDILEDLTNYNESTLINEISTTLNKIMI